ncbi:HK97-gp10 family putative phage morphogenesis protein [Devosia sp.]|uniref:HK97-gp10 family putative phage morphogenesis protein n=1 Tax=Devosia sp. TaxID=1871048 RepID=UPI001ACCEA70|nr:HK97-gp10 family putative phage morphogenesis protein [Devosia sp.]MBN9335378.1 HK97 gp10 family phage protein [Devosia sp.]
MAGDDDMARIRRRLMAIPDAIRAAMQPALDKSADEMVGMMKGLAPRDEGDLQASIQKEAGPHDLSRRIVAGGERTTRPVRDGADAEYDYALAQELGTKEMPANPFFRPVVRSSRKKVRNRLKRAAAKAVRDNWGSQ